MFYLIVGLGVLFLFLALWEFLRYYPTDEGSVVDKNRTLMSRASTDAGYIGSKIGKVISIARAELNGALSGETEAHIALHEAQTRSQIEVNRAPSKIKIGLLEDEENFLIQDTKTNYARALAELKSRADLAASNLTLVLSEGAANERMTVEDYSTLNRSVALDRARNATDYEKAINEIRASILYGQEATQLLAMQKEFLFKLYTERKTLQASDHIAKDDILLILNEYIGAEERAFREGFSNRLLQASPRQDLARSNQTANA